MRVWVVEDEAVLRDAQAVGLGLQGFRLETASLRQEAEAALLAGGFDAVLLDNMLPDGSGMELLRAVRRAGDATPVLLPTAPDGVENRIQGSTSAPTTIWRSFSA
ncbi:response regulator [Teichococcus deserti]|uniref:response regulator n=1 Tax=Teichococcus deserti TaxID=1817963 RepID=UPI001F61094E|nr:response regulator [Pseudoroseomonas deserti]